LTEPQETCTVAGHWGRHICQPCDLMPLQWNCHKSTVGYHKRSEAQTKTSQILGLNCIHLLCVVKGANCHLYITCSFLTAYNESKSRERERWQLHIPKLCMFPLQTVAEQVQ